MDWTRRKQMSRFLRYAVGFAFLIISAYNAGCKKTDEFGIGAGYLETLTDTVYAGEERMIFLSDGVGGFYFDDALGRRLRGSFGFSAGENKYIDEFRVSDAAGVDRREDVRQSAVTPASAKRICAGGFTETIELAFGLPGGVISLAAEDSKAMIVKPVFDIRNLSKTEAPEYRYYWDEDRSALILKRVNHNSKWVAVYFPQRASFNENVDYRQAEYPVSKLIGMPDYAKTFSAGEFLIKKTKKAKIIFAIGADSSEAIGNALAIEEKYETMRDDRRQWMVDVLESAVFKCENKRLERAYAWSRLRLRQLMVDNDGETFLLTGVPYAPYPSGWHTCLGLPGLARSGLEAEEVYSCLEYIIDRQDLTDLDSAAYGMYPSEVREDGVLYNIQEIAGLSVLAYADLKATGLPMDSLRDAKFAQSLVYDLMGTARSRLKNGLAANDSLDHFLADSPAAPARQGAAIESQILLNKVRDFLEEYPDLQSIKPEIPKSLIEGMGGRIKNKPHTPFISVGEAGQFSIPLLRQTILYNYKLHRYDWWADCIEFDLVDAVQMEYDNRPVYMDRIAQVLALNWHKENDRSLSNKILAHAVETELIGACGFRSLAGTDPEFEPEHVYRRPASGAGSMAYGDVLVWTAGILADLYVTTGRTDSLYNLVERLALRVMEQGAAGALPEAENGRAFNLQYDMVYSPVFFSSTAEFVRIMHENILGIDKAEGVYLKLSPRIPDRWGDVFLKIPLKKGSLNIHKDKSGLYHVRQFGIKPYLQLSLETYPEPGERGLGSLRVFPGESYAVEFVELEGDRWTANIRKE